MSKLRLLLPLLILVCALHGQNNQIAGGAQQNTYTVATLNQLHPASSLNAGKNDGVVYIITDYATSCNSGGGGGLFVAWCRSNGISYDLVGAPATLIPGNPPGGAGNSCSSTTIAYLAPNGTIYTCFGGFWTATGSGAPGASAFANYLAFGDSLTYGYTASSPYNGWPYWLASAAGLTNGKVQNDGIIGYFAGQMDPSIFSNTYPYSPSTLITYMIGTNNVNANSTNANQLQDYLQNIEAQLAWWYLPSSSKTLFGTGNVAYTGTWTTDTINNIGKQSTVNGSTATFTGTGTILYVVTEMVSSGGTATLTCDGVATGATLYFSGFNGVAPSVNQTSLTRVSGLSAGVHSCVISVTSSGSTVLVEWAGFTNGTATTNTPFVLLEGVPNQNTANGTVISALASYNTNQQTAVSLLQGDGFSNLAYVSNSTVGGSANAKLYNDQYHFTDDGYYLLAQPAITALSSLTGTTYSSGIFIPRPPSNFAGTGQNTLCMVYGACASATFNGIRVIGIGPGALAVATTPSDTISMGFNSLNTCTTCSNSVAIGSQTLQNVGNATRNAAVGAFSLFAATGTSSDNSAFGDAACQNGSAAFNRATCIGSQTGFSNTGNDNTFLGYSSGNSGTAVTSDTGLTLVGSTSQASAATGLSNASCLGFGCIVTASNQVVLGNASVTSTIAQGTLQQQTEKSCSTGLTTDASGNINGCVASDRRLKKNVRALDSAKVLMNLQPRIYQWKDSSNRDTREHAGFIAQEVEVEFPDAVINAGGNGDKGIDPNALLALVIKTVQEQQKEIDRLKRERRSLLKRLF